jgi:nucleoside phosphorylase
MNMRDFKICSKCHCSKPKNEFAKNMTMPGGLNYWCRKCHQACRLRAKQMNGKKLVLTASALGLSLSAKLDALEAGDTKAGT